MRGDYRQRLELSRDFRRTSDIYRRMAEAGVPTLLRKLERNIPELKKYVSIAEVYRTIPSTIAVINAQPSSIIRRSRFLRSP